MDSFKSTRELFYQVHHFETRRYSYDFWTFYLTSMKTIETQLKWASFTIKLQFYENIDQVNTRFSPVVRKIY